MKKATMIKKLAISKETLRRLGNEDLLQADGGSGGGWSDNSVCPTTTPSDRRICP
jgi:hypothetical protein